MQKIFFTLILFVSTSLGLQAQEVKTITYENGNVYVGEVNAYNQPHGKGEMTYSDGVYEGEWKDNNRSGYGKWTGKDGGTYEGEFSSNAANGKGKYKWPNGNSYEGEIANWQQTGQGKFYWADGGYHDGAFLNNNRHGFGKTVFPDGKVAEGFWENNNLKQKITPIKWTYSKTENTVMQDLEFLVNDALYGFPKSTGSLKSNDWSGRKYHPYKVIGGSSTTAALIYQPAKEKTKYNEASNELFYFEQEFQKDGEHYKFAADTLSQILEELAKGNGLTKKELKNKDEKVFVGKSKEYSYEINNKPLFSYHIPPSGNIHFRIYSSYRPADVKVENRLGYMVFSYSGFNKLWAVPVYGDKMGDVKTIAEQAYQSTGLSDNNYQYTWMPDYSFYNIQQRYKSTYKNNIQEMNGYYID